VISTKLYLMMRIKRGDVLHEAKKDSLVAVPTCWSIFGRARVLLGYLSLGFWRV
jgi:hypothetical protein